MDNEGLMLSTLLANVEVALTVARTLFFPLMLIAGDVVIMKLVSIH